jgi:hypothetical protein
MAVEGKKGRKGEDPFNNDELLATCFYRSIRPQGFSVQIEPSVGTVEYG